MKLFQKKRVVMFFQIYFIHFSKRDFKRLL